MNKTLKLSAIVLLLIFGVGYLLSPYIIIYEYERAINARDFAAVAEYIDFPALRESVKNSLRAKLMNENTKPGSDDPGMRFIFESELGPKMIDRAVDNMFTPEGFVSLMNGKMNELDGKISHQLSPGAIAIPASREERSMGYQSLNRFVLKSRARGASTGNGELIFARHGLFSWKLLAFGQQGWSN